MRSATRCTSHFVSETTLAKPIAEQMAMMRVAFVIDLSNCLKAIIGSSESSAIKIPAESRTRRVSQRLISAAIAPIVTTSATPMDHVILRYTFGWEETTVGRALFRFFSRAAKRRILAKSNDNCAKVFFLRKQIFYLLFENS